MNDDIPLSVLFSALALMLVLSAFFSASETALMTLNRYRLQHLVKQKHKGAIKAQRLLQRPDRIISFILIGNNFANTFASSIATVIAIHAVGEQSVAIAATILTFLILIFAEITPKTLAAFKPEKIAFAAAWIHTPLLKIFYPVVWFVNLITSVLLRLFGVQVNRKQPESLNKDELKSILSDAHNLMPSRYRNMLLGILDLESATVEDVMTPRNEIIGIDLEDPIEEITQQILHSPHTRLPVYKKSIDRVIGFLHLRIVLSRINEPGFDKQRIIDNLLKPFFIPISTPLHKQMQNFKAENLRIGLVVNEYGDVEGLVTLDDLLQEIIGELTIEEAADVKKQADGSYLVDASITIRDLNRLTQWTLPTEGPKTLNGLIIEFMETIPKPGTSLKLHGYVIEIIECDAKTIKLVKFHQPDSF